MKGKLIQRLTRDIDRLGSASEKVAHRAEWRLLRSATRLRRFGPKAIDLLIAATRHPTPQVRFRALWVLAATHAPGVYPVLLALTDDPEEAVRYDATMAFGKFGYVEAVEPLVHRVRQGEREDSLESAAGTSLMRLGRRSVLPVIELLQHEDPRVRHIAANVLGGIRDPRAIEPLAALLHDPVDWVRRTAVDVLEELGDPSYWNTNMPRPTKGGGVPRCIDRCLDLIAACENDPDEWMQKQAAFWQQRGYGKPE